MTEKQVEEILRAVLAILIRKGLLLGPEFPQFEQEIKLAAERIARL